MVSINFDYDGKEFRACFSRVLRPFGRNPQRPDIEHLRGGGKREGSDAERTALGPDADLLPIPYPSIVELR